MFAYFIRRLVTLVPTLVFVSMLIFGLQQLLPGDPAQMLAGEDQNPELIAQLRAKMHLDEPLPVRYGYWMGGVLQGDLGESVRTQQPVLSLVLQKLPVTVELALLAMTIALLIGILIFNESPDVITLSGSALIVASGLYSFARERARKSGETETQLRLLVEDSIDRVHRQLPAHLAAELNATRREILTAATDPLTFSTWCTDFFHAVGQRLARTSFRPTEA